MSVLDRFRLDGKRLLITGGSRGLGREMALAIAEAGADVMLVGRDQASLEKTADDVRQRGRVAATIMADVGIPAEASLNGPRSTFSSTMSAVAESMIQQPRCRSTSGSQSSI
jgi:NAD(P)-dependent dehydrogenase (short-subunit alcohol dehydrogenase family)